jgi:hypothetical protein
MHIYITVALLFLFILFAFLQLGCGTEAGKQTLTFYLSLASGRSSPPCSSANRIGEKSTKTSLRVCHAHWIVWYIVNCGLTFGLSLFHPLIEGVLVAKKDFNAPKHEDLEEVPNLQVIKAMQSLTSQGFVKTRFSWQYYYYTLTDEGLEYLRGW